MCAWVRVSPPSSKGPPAGLCSWTGRGQGRTDRRPLTSSLPQGSPCSPPDPEHTHIHGVKPHIYTGYCAPLGAPNTGL